MNLFFSSPNALYDGRGPPNLVFLLFPKPPSNFILPNPGRVFTLFFSPFTFNEVYAPSCPDGAPVFFSGVKLLRFSNPLSLPSPTILRSRVLFPASTPCLSRSSFLNTSFFCFPIFQRPNRYPFVYTSPSSQRKSLFAPQAHPAPAFSSRCYSSTPRLISISF